MKKQIKRLSPHQNGKVFGVLMAVATLPMFLPMMLMMAAMTPNGGDDTPNFPFVMMLVFPIFYLIFGYISIALMCFFYNVLQKYIGGFEYESGDISSQVETS